MCGEDKKGMNDVQIKMHHAEEKRFRG